MPAVGTLGTIPNLTIGGMIFTDLTNLFSLRANISVNGPTYSTFYKDFSTAGYAVTSAKTLRFYAAIVQVYVASAATNATNNINIGYGDTDVGQNSAAAPTNPVYLVGANQANLHTLVAIGDLQISFGPIPIPAGKYPFVYTGDNAKYTIAIYGYET